MSKEISYLNKKTFIFTLIVTICLQFTEVKIFHIKFSEIGLIILSVFLVSNNSTIHKYIFWFSCFFVALLAKTLVQNHFTSFFINAPLPLLRQPYFISISRFIELFCCMVFTYFVALYLKKMPVAKVLELLNTILKIQIYFFSFFLVLFYALYKVHLLSFVDHDGFLAYDPTGIYGDVSYRLKGLFVEGGPFGLFYAYLFILYDWILKQTGKSDLIGRLIILLIIFLAASKAGYSLMIVFFAINIYGWAKNSRYAFILKKVTLPVILIGSVVILFFVATNYIDLLKEGLQPSQSTDQAIVMGRVSGMIISPNIIMNHYLMGIGLGNYPLVRNNPLYLSYFPQISVDLWDSSGLGGLVDLMIDGGILFLVVFAFIFYKLYKDVKKINKTLYPLLYSFILPFVFGVQLYYLYPWFSLGLIIYFLQQKYVPKPQLNELI